jgi:hypothetical protein
LTEAKYRQLANQVEAKARIQTQSSPAELDDGSLLSPGSCVSNDTPYPDYLSSPEPPQLHLPLDQMLRFWNVFINRVNPVTRLIHRPSLEARVFGAQDGTNSMDNPLRTLIYSICYAAVVNTPASDAQVCFGETKNVLSDRFQTAIEKSLAVSHSTNDFMTLQALVLYLVSTPS